MTSSGKSVVRCALLMALLTLPAVSAPVLVLMSQSSGVPCVTGSWGFRGVFPEQWLATGPVEGAGISTSAEGSVYVAARADYGSLGVIVETAASAAGAMNGTAMAFMRDTWTIAGGAPGTTGTIAIVVALDGSYDFQ